ncbi:Fpg/Nei family DNA glycosylase [Salinibacter ruber]|uniref:Fpg/Nei family DNA glycosylase n=1 Tax=Salinibacter ruber TaxID=146919 RepID=UPI00216970F3|nr:DNA-formamidopyrimidine glycosylase family protein [Salinibacter ruber]MCS4134096.1 formamidopyrimidine-DNA glycosylase [Salinibacter ruber]
MPELPDAVVYRRRLADAALDRPIADATVVDPRILGDGLEPHRLGEVLRGRTLTDTHRHGKHVFVRYGEETGWLALHFGMTGRVQVVPDGTMPEYAYVQVHFEDGGALAFECPRKFARVRLVDTPDAFVEAKDLGPDARRADVDTFLAPFASRRGAIKGRLLDQSVVAGLGNIYADEALYQEGIHPRTTVPELSETDLRGLYDAIQRVLDAAIAVDADPEALDPDRFMLPHRYGDEHCPKTGVPLETETVSGRTAYVSPARQSPPG